MKFHQRFIKTIKSLCSPIFSHRDSSERFFRKYDEMCHIIWQVLNWWNGIEFVDIVNNKNVIKELFIISFVLLIGNSFIIKSSCKFLQI